MSLPVALPKLPPCPTDPVLLACFEEPPVSTAGCVAARGGKTQNSGGVTLAVPYEG